MVSKVTPGAPLPEISSDRGAHDHASPTQGEGGNYALTSHSFTLSTRLFSLDFTWRRLQVEGRRPPAAPAPDAPSPPPAPRSKHRVQAGQPDFSEALKRQQLASLLLETAPPPPGCQTIQVATAATAFAGPARRAYLEAAPAGPLAGGRFHKV